MWECLKAVIYSFNLFIANIFHRWRITKMESWRSSKVPSSTMCSSWQQCSKSKFNWKSDFGTEVRFGNSAKPRRMWKGNFKCKAQQIEHLWCANTSPNDIKKLDYWKWLPTKYCSEKYWWIYRIEFSKESFKGREKLIILWSCNAS